MLVEAITIRHLLADQITVLELLQPLFVQTGDLSGIATGSEAGSIGRGNGDREEEEEEEDLFTAEVITIPVISASSKIEVRRIHAMIRKVIAQRKGMQDKMAEMIGSLKDMVSKGGSAGEGGGANSWLQCKSTEQEVIKETVKEQLRNAELLGDEITTQGKTLSMFTAVNVLFLPLGFFSQVYNPATQGFFISNNRWLGSSSWPWTQSRPASTRKASSGRYRDQSQLSSSPSRYTTSSSVNTRPVRSCGFCGSCCATSDGSGP